MNETTILKAVPAALNLAKIVVLSRRLGHYRSLVIFHLIGAGADLFGRRDFEFLEVSNLD